MIGVDIITGMINSLGLAILAWVISVLFFADRDFEKHKIKIALFFATLIAIGVFLISFGGG